MNRKAISLIFLVGSAIAALGFVRSLPKQSDEPLQWFLDRSSDGSPLVPKNVLDPKTKKIRYFMSRDAYSQANRVAELNSIRASFGQWESIPGTRIEFEEGGLMSPPLDVDLPDQTNVVFWAKESTIVADGRLDISGGLAKAALWFASDGTIIEADIVFNGVQRQWFTDIENRDSNKTFIEGVALHEIGHMLGLAHSPVGGAVMLSRSGAGTSNAQIGLSSDEITFAQSLYAAPGQANPNGEVKGVVTRNNLPVHGAVITLEDSHGNVTAGTVTRENGAYSIPGLTAGSYNIRVTPLAPENVFPSLIRGPDLEPLTFTNAVTEFLPIENQPLQLGAGETETKDFSVTGGSPPFRITGIRRASASASSITISSSPTSVEAGSQNVSVGVFSPDITSDATVEITGDGITQHSTDFREDLFGDQNLVSASIDVAADATPGMRSFIVRDAGHAAYANGFLEILPRKLDLNFDGLDDNFQRTFFPIFTSSEAGPEADPDDDGFTNEREAESGSDPTDASSIFFNILEVKLTSQGTRITWESGPGKAYKVLRRDRFGRGSWETIETVTASSGAQGEVSSYLDTSATEVMHFYRIQAVLP